ncbi:MAG: phenylalanine--tRNA ligase subunit beta [Candidatus Nomurabacteria bacterium]|nr:MAG: phenylalanine--tRNA ligase subunit beta [Candidatus Nomurabacteria bacterium]
MHVSHRWAAEFVTMPKPEQVRALLDAAGLPVESIKSDVAIADTVIIGHVLNVLAHPNADRLRIAEVNIGDGGLHRIVCGGPNLAQGQKVAVATPGTVLPNGQKIERSKIRGEESAGMLCAEDELGIGESHAGILVLPDNAPIGRPVTEVLKGKDLVYEISVTPNRSDCLSVLGIAREIAAASGKKLPTAPKGLRSKGKSPVKVRLQNKDCAMYLGQRMTKVRVQASPDWLQQRLQAAGVRPINNVVDIVNYVMLELGQPMHAFDAAKLSGETIQVRPAKAGESLLALDGKRYSLKPSMMLIADAKNPIAIAGVMGGEESGVTETSTDIILEAAVFASDSVYHTSRALQLSSESSQRFSKGIDPEMTGLAMQRAVQLLQAHAGAQPVGGVVQAGKLPKAAKPVRVSVTWLNEFLGTDIPATKIKKLLSSLGMKVSGSAKTLSVTPPSWRHDISLPEDVAEEVARLSGYNAIIRTVPPAPGRPVALPAQDVMTDRLADAFAQLGFHEHIGYAYVPEVMVQDDLKQAVRISNPLSAEQEYLRTSLIPGLLQVAAKNAKTHSDQRLFEFGKAYQRSGNTFTEDPMLLVLWQGSEKAVMEFSSLLRTVLEHHFGVTDFRLQAGENEVKILVQGQSVGRLLQASPLVLRNHKLSGLVRMAEFRLEALQKALEKAKIRYTEIPAYPEVKRDLALWIKAEIRYTDIEGIIRATPLITDFALFDVYEKEGKRSLAFHLSFRAADRTLSSDEVDASMHKLREALRTKVNAEVRS